MTFSQYAGTAIVPTFARLVLAAAFVAAGWNKVRDQPTYNAGQAARLRAMGVNVEPVQPVAAAVPHGGADEGSGATILRASFTSFRPQEPGAQPAGTNPAQDPPEDPSAGTTPPQTPPQAPGTVAPPAAAGAVAPLPEGTYRALGMYHITLLLDDAKIGQPWMRLWGARLSAFTELLGGAMLLVGLLSRLWGLALAFNMGVAFYLVSIRINGIFTMDPFTFAQDLARFNGACTQLGLCVLALGLLLTGGGPLSVDRILFGAGGGEEPGFRDATID